MQDDPMLLPCAHVLCSGCVEDVRLEGDRYVAVARTLDMRLALTP